MRLIEILAKIYQLRKLILWSIVKDLVNEYDETIE